MEKIRGSRKEIDEIDDKIIDLLDDRIRIAEEIAKVKMNDDVDITDKNRENNVLENAGEYREIYEKIIEKTKEIERRFAD